MRTIVDIICAVKDEQAATDEELRLALVALSGWSQQAARNLRLIHERTKDTHASLLTNGAFEGYFNMMKADPRSYLGDRGTPGTETNKRFVAISKKVVKKATGLDV